MTWGHSGRVDRSASRAVGRYLSTAWGPLAPRHPCAAPCANAGLGHRLSVLGVEAFLRGGDPGRARFRTRVMGSTHPRSRSQYVRKSKLVP
jgi:hypothetical protein